ncbi:MAG: glycosyltransferase family 4 protein [Acidobacteria bacterium]|nr:glycosyltransferase family 4 protein [Acidobacteriota bacterium]
MNILLVAYYFPPINSAGSQRPVQMAHWLRRCGHAVSVLTHGYDEGKATSTEIIRIHDPAYVRAHRGARFWRWLFWRGLAEMQNSLGHYASIFSPWRREVLARAEEIRRVSRPELIIATYPPLEGLEIGIKLSRRWRIPLVSDFRDGLMFQPIEEKRIRAHSCIRRKYEKIEAASTATSTRITVVTPVLQKYFREAYPGCNCEIVYNGYDPQERLNLPAIFFPPGFFHIVHTGRLALSDSAADMRPFLAALRQTALDAPQHPIRLHLVGEHSQRERAWMGELLKKGIVTIHPLMDRRQSLAFQKSADLLLVLTRPGVRSGIPLKLFEYLQAGKPILAVSDDLEVRRIIEESGRGWCESPLDEKALESFLLRISTVPSLSHSLNPDPQAIEAYSWERQMRRLNGMLPPPPVSP